MHDCRTIWHDDVNAAWREVYAEMRASYPSARAYAAAAARADYEFLRAWCNDEWSYCGVIVTAYRNRIELGRASLWGIESNAGEYLRDVANELLEEALEEARASNAQSNGDAKSRLCIALALRPETWKSCYGMI